MSETTSPTILSYPGAVVDRGDTGAGVRAVQQRLNAELGGADLAVDGQFGAGTEAAVRRFQQAEGLQVDGDVGPITWATLFDGGPAATQAPSQSPNAADAAAARAAATQASSVEVKLRTFIPAEAINVPYDSSYVNGGDQIDGAGDRGFSSSDDASFRTSQSALLRFSPDGDPLPVSSAGQPSETGSTYLFDKEDASPVDGWRWQLDEGANWVGEAKLEATSIPKPEVSARGDTFVLDFELSAKNPLPPPADVVFAPSYLKLLCLLPP